MGASPSAIVFTPDSKTAYVATGVFHQPSSYSGTVTPIDTATNTAGRPIPVPGGPLAIAPDGKTLYVLSGRATVTPIDTSTNTPGPAISLSPSSYLELSMAPDGKTLYVLSHQTGITPIDTQTNTAGPAIAVGGTDMAITPDGKTIWGTDTPSTVAWYDPATGTGKRISLAGSNPNIEVAYYVAVSP